MESQSTHEFPVMMSTPGFHPNLQMDLWFCCVLHPSSQELAGGHLGRGQSHLYQTFRFLQPDLDLMLWPFYTWFPHSFHPP
jgi:hypothetical protein